jgi:DNA-directed RNA polymerase
MSDPTMINDVYEQQRKREAEAVANAYIKMIQQEDERALLNDASNTLWANSIKHQILRDIILELKRQEKDNETNPIKSTEVRQRTSEATDAIKKCLGVDLVALKRKAKLPPEEAAKIKTSRSYFNLEQAAFIALQLTLDNALSPQMDSTIQSRSTGDAKRSKAQVDSTTLSQQIGTAVQNECWYKMMNHNLHHWHNAIHQFAMTNSDDVESLRSSTRYYESTIKKQAEKKAAKVKLSEDVEFSDEIIETLDWKPWERREKVHVGRWLQRAVMMVAESYGLFTEEQRYTTSKDKDKGKFILLGTFGEQYKEQIEQDIAQYCWESIPMVCEPLPHTKKQVRGYLTESAWYNPKSYKGFIKLSDEHLAFINKLQSVPYKLNPFILELFEHLSKYEMQLGKFCPISFATPRTVAERLNLGSIADYDEQTEAVLNHPYYKEARKERSNDFARNKFLAKYGNAVNTRGLMRLIRSLKGYDKFWIPTYWDFRGRVYYATSFLSPQAYDPGKGVLQFATPTKVDKLTGRYLKLSISAALGMDKLSYQQRLDEVDKLEKDITKVALMFTDNGDPSGAISFLESMGDDVFEGAAACEEYYWCCLAPIDQRRSHTHYRCALDATAQGAQLISGFRKSKEGAAKVNVLPCDQPNDVYMNLWDALVEEVTSKAYIREDILDIYRKQGYGRNLAKKGILMSAQYGSGVSKQIATFKEILKDIPANLQLNEDELKAFFGYDEDKKNGIPEYRPFKIALEKTTSLTAFVDWIRARATAVLKTKRTCFVIPTVTGSQLVMKYPKQKKTQILTFHHSSISLNPLVSRFDHNLPTKVPDKKAWMKAAAANSIHLQDSTLLAHAFHNWEFNLSTVHDSIISAPGLCMKVLEDRFKRSFIDVISWDFFGEVYKANGLALDGNVYSILVDDLDPQDVIKANYLVC